MNLPDYVRAMNQAADQFQKACAMAGEEYQAAISKARNAFFEDDENVPMTREEFRREMR